MITCANNDCTLLSILTKIDNKMDAIESNAGKAITQLEGYRAFVPHRLPPKIAWSDRVISALSRADFLLGKLAREGARLPNPHLLIRPFITREAVLSSKIEGTHATIGEVLAASAGARVQHDLDDLQEVQNYIAALDFGIERLANIPLSIRLIRELHKKLMLGVRGSHATPGEFRTSQNWIGPPGCTLNTAKFVPPPPHEMMDCLSDLEKFLHNRHLPPLIHLAISHYQFEAIHPFIDGNGRIGRLLISLLLLEREILPTPLLYLSAYFEATRDEYYRQLYNLSATGDWNEWFIYFLSGIAVQSKDALSRAERINEHLDTWKILVSGNSSQVSLSIIECFAKNPFLTIKKIASELNIAYSTAKRGTDKLEGLGIIKQINPVVRDKIYCAVEILDILEEPAHLE